MGARWGQGVEGQARRRLLQVEPLEQRVLLSTSPLALVAEGIADLGDGELPPPPQLGAIQGYKWHDLNGNREWDTGEPPLENWTIFLDEDGDGRPSGTERETQTLADGSYSLTDLNPGTYTVAEVIPDLPPGTPGWRQTFPESSTHIVEVVDGPVPGSYNFGNQRLGGIQVFKWEDLDGEGDPDVAEPPLAGWTVFLDANGNGLLDDGESSRQTEADGECLFLNLVPGSYVVAEEIPLGWVQTSPGGPDSHLVIVNGGQVPEVIFGNREAEIFGTVFDDLDRDGEQDANELGLAGWTVTLDLFSDASIDDTVTTDAQGHYGFIGVEAGTHIVAQQVEAPYVQTAPSPPGHHSVELIEGVPLTDPYDFGNFYPPDLAPGWFFLNSPGLESTPVTGGYMVVITGPGVLGPNDQWTEEVWLTDDGLVDGQGWEKLLLSETRDDVGFHTITVTPPSLGTVASTDGDGVVTSQMIHDGMSIVLRLDPPPGQPGQLIETDDTNNELVYAVRWDLPDLVVTEVGSRLGFDFETGELIVPDELIYTVTTWAGPVPAGVEWVEQAWLGTDEDVLAADDPAAGVWHMPLAIGDEIPDTEGPIDDFLDEVERTVPLGLGRMPLPKGILPSDLHWIILLDRPEGTTIEEAEPGAVPELSESWGDPTNNAFVQPVLGPVLIEGADLGSGRPSVSADGRFVAFDALAGGQRHVFVHDRDADGDDILDEPNATATVQIDVSPSGDPANGPSSEPSISADGRYVAFISEADNLVPGDATATADIFVRDRDPDENGAFDEPGTGQTTLVSIRSDGQQLSSFGNPVISGDGRYVVFGSPDEDLVPGSNLLMLNPLEDPRHPFAADNNGHWDLFVHDRAGGTTTPVPLDEDWSSASSGEVVVTADPGPSYTQVDEGTVRTTLGAFFAEPAWLYDGGQLVRHTNIDLVRVGDEIRYEIYCELSNWGVYDIETARGEVSLTPIPGIEITDVYGNGILDSWSGGFSFELTDPGNTVSKGWVNVTATVVAEPPEVFDLVATVTSLTAEDDDGAPVPVAIPDPVTLQLRVQRRDLPGSWSPTMSGTGARMALIAYHESTTDPGLFVYDLGSPVAREILDPEDVDGPSISGDGRYVAFSSTDDDLVPNDANGSTRDVFVVDVGSGRVALASASSSGQQSANHSRDPSIASGSGPGSASRWFTAFAHPGVPNDLADDAMTTTLIRDSLGLTQPAAEPDDAEEFTPDLPPALAGNGRWVAWVTESEVVAEDTDGEWDLYVAYVEHAVVGQVHGYVFQDLDKSGERDLGEGGHPDWLVQIEDVAGKLAPQVVRTDENGFYDFDVVADRTYKLTIEQRPPLLETLPGDPDDPGHYTVRVNPDGSTEPPLRNGSAQDPVDSPDFGLFLPPDLVVADLPEPTGQFGQQATIAYAVGQLGPGGLQPTDTWRERLYVTDDGEVGNGGYELELIPAEGEAALRFTGPGGVGARSFTLTMPELGDPASATGQGVVTPQMVKDGLSFVVVLDTEETPGDGQHGEVLEADEDNNQTAAGVEWALPNLTVVLRDVPQLAFGAELDDLTYLVANDGDAAVPVGVMAGQPVQWVEQVWLGTDTDVLAPDDPVNGVWHHQASVATTDIASGPLDPSDEVARTITPDLRGVTLPSEIELSDLRWIVLVDWPDGQTAGEADPAIVLETHEVYGPDPEVDGEPANAFEFLAMEIDLDPLAIEVVGGSLGYNGRANRFEVQGTTQIGFKPDDGLAFEALLTVDGLLWFSETLIHAEGIVTAEIGGLGEAMFEGVFEIGVGNADTTAVNDVLDVFELVGVEVQLDRFALAVPPGGTTLDGQIEIQGSLALPDSLGGVGLSITGDHMVVITDTGVGITGGQISFPDVEFDLLGVLPIQAVDMSVEYFSDPQMFRIRGALSLPTVFNITADFSGDNFIQISEEGVDVVGVISAEDLELVPGLWEIKTLAVGFNTLTDEIQADGELLIPTGIVIVAGVGFREGALNYVKLGADDLNKPIGSTGAFLQRIVGQVDHIAEADPEPISFGGEVGVTAGPEISISLPSWAGGDFEGALVELLVSGEIDAHHLEARGDLDIIGGVISGTAGAELNWDKGYLAADASLDCLAGLVVYEASFHANSNLDITMSAGATVSIPDVIPVIGGEPVISGQGYFQFRNDDDSTTDYVAGWGVLDLPVIGEIKGGVRVRFDGEWDIIGSEEIEGIPGGSETYTLATGVPWALFCAEWVNEAPGVPIQLTAPDSTVYTEADIVAAPNMAIVDDLSDLTSRTVVVEAPDAGEWTVSVPEGPTLGPVDYTALIGSASPTLELTAPTDDTAEANVIIAYDAFDPDSDAQIALYFDTDRGGYDGVLITEGLAEADGPGSFVWDTSAIAAGDYYLYGTVVDAQNPPVFSAYSLGRVHVADPDAPAQVEGLEAKLVNGGDVRLTWAPAVGAASYLVSYTADAAGEFYTHTVTNDTQLEQATLSGLIRGETYRFKVEAVDLDGRIGEASVPVVCVAGPLATIEPGPGEWHVFADPATLVAESIALDPGDTLALIKAPADATLDTDTGLFEWQVPDASEGWHEVVIRRTDADGDVELIRRHLLVDPSRTGDIQGHKFHDVDGDGHRDDGEPGLEAWTVYLDLDGSGTLGHTVTFGSGESLTPIPDERTGSSEILVNGLTGTVVDVDVALDITHPRDADLEATLIGPSGAQVQLLSGVGNGGADFTETVLDDEAATAIAAGTPPFTGTFQPQQLLAAFDGEDPSGTWTLQVTDGAAGEVGVLKGWALTITMSEPVEPHATTDTSGEYQFVGLTPGDYTVAEVVQDGWDCTLPGPSGAHAVVLQGGDSLDLDFGNSPQPATVEGRAWHDWDDDHDQDPGEPGVAGWTVFADLNGNGAPDQAAVTTNAAGGPVELPDLSQVTAPLLVTGMTGTVVDLNVSLDIAHTYDGDLDVTLHSPSGRRVLLFSDVGDAGDGFIGLTLDDEASTSVTLGAAPFTGSFRPEGVLAGFDGDDPNGVWTLEVIDDSAADAGALNGWSITVTVAEPTATTDSDGNYVLTRLPAGPYRIAQAVEAGWQQTSPTSPATHDLTLAPGQTAQQADFGNLEGLFVEPGGLTVDLRVMDDGWLSLTGPAPTSMTIDGIDLNGGSPSSQVAIRLGDDPNAGWLRIHPDGHVRADDTAEQWYQVGEWIGRRWVGLTTGSECVVHAKAGNGLGAETGLAEVARFTTNLDCDVNRSGIVTALDYALIRAGHLRGGELGVGLAWALDADGDGDVDGNDLSNARDRILNPEAPAPPVPRVEAGALAIGPVSSAPALTPAFAQASAPTPPVPTTTATALPMNPTGEDIPSGSRLARIQALLYHSVGTTARASTLDRDGDGDVDRDDLLASGEEGPAVGDG